MRKKKTNPYKWLVLIVSILFVAVVSAISFTDLYNYDSPLVTSNSSINLGWNISAPDGLSQVKFSWDNQNSSLYDNSLVLMYNFNNFSALGENDTVVKDLSMYGNNGTVIGGENISWTPNGKYGGAFNFSGIAIINFTNKVINVSSLCFWIKPNTISKTQNIVVSAIGSEDTAFFIGSGTKYGIYSGSTVYSEFSAILNAWQYVCYIFNGTGYDFYLNNIKSTTGINKGIINVTRLSSTSSTNWFNGSIDDLMIFNRSLSSLEISQLYKSQLTKYNSQNWSFQTNQSLNAVLNSSTTSYNFPYYICSSNSTSSENCTSQRTITQTIPTKTLTVNFTTNIGNVRNDFYSITSSDPWGSNLTWIDVNGDGILDTPSNYTFYRELLDNANINYYRMYLYLDSLSVSEGVLNDTAIFNNYANINTLKDMVNYAKSYNKKILFSTVYIPTWLENRTLGYCNSTSWRTCPPSNYTKYGNLVVDVLNSIGCNPSVCEIEIGNEPDYEGFWLNNLSRTNINRSIEYNKLYNASYIAIKNLNLSYQVGGAVTTSSIQSVNPFVFVNWISNFSNQIDFIDEHNYLFQANTQFTKYDDSLAYDISWIIGNMTLYNVNTTRIVFSELNLWNDSILNSSVYYNYREMQSALVYSYGINNYPANLSLGYWKLANNRNYNPSNGFKFFMVSEGLLDNYIDGVYYTISNFAHLCPAGGTVYKSSSDDNTIKVVTCKDNSKYNVIIINTDTVSKNQTLNINPIGTYTGKPIGSITDYLTGTNYVIIDNQTNLGISDSYNINYLTYNPVSFKLVENDKFYQYDSFNNNLEPNRQDMWISSNTKNKHIVSQLIQSVNTTIVTNLGDCDTINYVKYTTDSGIITEWKGQSAHDICNQLKSGVILQVDPSTSSNILSWDEGTTGLASAMLKVLIVVLALGLLIMVMGIFYVYVKNNFNEVPAIDIIKAFITFLIVEILIIALLVYISEII